MNTTNEPRINQILVDDESITATPERSDPDPASAAQAPGYSKEITTPACVCPPPTVASSGTSPVPRPAGTVKLIW